MCLSRVTGKESEGELGDFILPHISCFKMVNSSVKQMVRNHYWPVLILPLTSSI